jgi:hypothetical protein
LDPGDIRRVMSSSGSRKPNATWEAKVHERVYRVSSSL